MKKDEEREDRLPKKPPPLEEGLRKDGKSNVAIPPETIQALRQEREQGATFEDLADQFDLAINTVRKYCADIVTIPQRQLAEKRIAAAAEKGVVGQHIIRVTADAKKKDEEVIRAGEGMQKAFEKFVEEKLAGGGGSASFNDLKEILMMKFMMKTMGGDEGQGQQSSIIQEMRAENDRQRQFYEDKLKDQDAKLREMFFEKKIQTMEEKQVETETALLDKLEDISAKVEEYRTPLVNATPEQKKDAITQLEEAGNQLERMRGTLTKLGLIQASPGAPAAEGKEVWRNPDGTVDKSMYIVDALKTTVGEGIAAWGKKTPEPGKFTETPAPPAPQPQRYVMQMDPDEYYSILKLKQNLNESDKSFMRKWEQIHPAQPAPALVVEQPARLCRACGRPEIYQGDLCEQCWNDQNRVPEQPEPEQPKKGMIERLKEQEEEEVRRTQGLV